jgi:hypothetical protein
MSDEGKDNGVIEGVVVGFTPRPKSDERKALVRVIEFSGRPTNGPVDKKDVVEYHELDELAKRAKYNQEIFDRGLQLKARENVDRLKREEVIRKDSEEAQRRGTEDGGRYCRMVNTVDGRKKTEMFLGKLVTDVAETGGYEVDSARTLVLNAIEGLNRWQPNIDTALLIDGLDERWKGQRGGLEKKRKQCRDFLTARSYFRYGGIEDFTYEDIKTPYAIDAYKSSFRAGWKGEQDRCDQLGESVEKLPDKPWWLKRGF